MVLNVRPARWLVGASIAWGLGCGDSSAPHVTPDPPLDAAKQLIWRDSLLTSAARPALDDGAAYFLGLDHRVGAVSKEDGSVRWIVNLPVSVPNRNGYGVNVAGGTVVVGDIDLFGLDPTTGRIVWTFAPSVGRRPGFQRQTTDGATVYCGSVTGHVYAVDGRTGAERWVARVAPDTDALVFSPVLDDGVVYVGYTDFVPGAAAQLGGAAAIDAASGRVLWSRALPQPDPAVGSGGYAPVAVTPELVVAPTYDGWVHGLDRSTGTLRVSLPPTAFVKPPEAPRALEARTIGGNGTIALIGSELGWITALAGPDLHKLWMTNVGRGTPFDILADDKWVYTGYPVGQFSLTRVSDGSLVWLVDRGTLRPMDRFEGIVSGPATDGLRIYVGGQHEVYAFKAP